MFGSSAPRGPCRAIWLLIGVLVLAVMPGCASTRGPISTPSGPRWLGPADPIAASRPPAITYNPYQGSAPESTPGGLARFFPGQRAGQSASPSLQPAAGPAAGRMLAATDPAAEPPLGPRRLSSRGPAALATATSSPAADRGHEQMGELLPVALALETYEDSPGPSDPETRLVVSQRTAEPAPETVAPTVDGPDELPDFGDPATESVAAPEFEAAVAAPPKAVRPESVVATDPALGTPRDQPRRPSRLKGLLKKFRSGRVGPTRPLFGGKDRETTDASN